MNNSNESVNEILDLREKITIDKLINQSTEVVDSSNEIKIDKLINSPSFEANHITNLRIISRPDSARVKTLSYKQILLKNIDKNK
jgi:hypothetical protein